MQLNVWMDGLCSLVDAYAPPSTLSASFNNDVDHMLNLQLRIQLLNLPDTKYILDESPL